MTKSDPTKDPEFQNVVRHLLNTPPKPHKEMKIGKREAKPELKERSAPKGSIHKIDWLVAPLQNGCMCLNLWNADTFFVGILQIPESRVKDYLDGFNGSASDLRVFHFPMRGDIGIFEAVDRFIAKRFDGSSRVVAAFYGNGAQRDFQRHLESADARDIILQGGSWHTVTPISGASATCEKRAPSA
jgi:hypothetical protein